MAITTLANVKSILNIPTADKDWRISALIPLVESDYRSIRNKPFDVGTVLNIETTGITADEEITLTIGNFAAVGSSEGREYGITLRANDTANVIAQRIVNQIEPIPYYTIKTNVASSTSTSVDVYFIERFPEYMEKRSVLDMSADTSTEVDITFEKAQPIYPDGAEITAIQMIQFQLNTPGGVKSEKLGDYSVTYGDALNGYPKEIAGKIRRFVKMI